MPCCRQLILPIAADQVSGIRVKVRPAQAKPPEALSKYRAAPQPGTVEKAADNARQAEACLTEEEQAEACVTGACRAFIPRSCLQAPKNDGLPDGGGFSSESMPAGGHDNTCEKPGCSAAWQTT
jgi:hypothetical protein